MVPVILRSALGFLYLNRAGEALQCDWSQKSISRHQAHPFVESKARNSVCCSNEIRETAVSGAAELVTNRSADIRRVRLSHSEV
eukprot:5881029-Pyramimonas_sp.AAC.1